MEIALHEIAYSYCLKAPGEEPKSQELKTFRCVGCNRLCCVCYSNQPDNDKSWNDDDYVNYRPTLCDVCRWKQWEKEKKVEKKFLESFGKFNSQYDDGLLTVDDLANNILNAVVEYKEGKK